MVWVLLMKKPIRGKLTPLIAPVAGWTNKWLHEQQRQLDTQPWVAPACLFTVYITGQFKELT